MADFPYPSFSWKIQDRFRAPLITKRFLDGPPFVGDPGPESHC